MMRYTAAVLVASIGGLVAIALIGAMAGLDGVLLSACAAGVGAIPAGLLAYLRGRSAGRRSVLGGEDGNA